MVTLRAGGNPRLECNASPFISTSHPKFRSHNRQSSKILHKNKTISKKMMKNLDWRAAQCGPEAWTGRERRILASIWVCTPALELWSIPLRPPERLETSSSLQVILDPVNSPILADRDRRRERERWAGNGMARWTRKVLSFAILHIRPYRSSCFNISFPSSFSYFANETVVSLT